MLDQLIDYVKKYGISLGFGIKQESIKKRRIRGEDIIVHTYIRCDRSGRYNNTYISNKKGNKIQRQEGSIALSSGMLIDIKMGDGHWSPGVMSITTREAIACAPTPTPATSGKTISSS